MEDVSKTRKVLHINFVQFHWEMGCVQDPEQLFPLRSSSTESWVKAARGFFRLQQRGTQGTLETSKAKFGKVNGASQWHEKS